MVGQARGTCGGARKAGAANAPHRQHLTIGYNGRWHCNGGNGPWIVAYSCDKLRAPRVDESSRRRLRDGDTPHLASPSPIAYIWLISYPSRKSSAVNGGGVRWAPAAALGARHLAAVVVHATSRHRHGKLGQEHVEAQQPPPLQGLQSLKPGSTPLRPTTADNGHCQRLV